MKAIAIQRYGGPEVLEEMDLEVREPGEGEVLVRIHAAGINPVDWKIREGRLRDRMPNRFPITLGWDLAGTVEKRGWGARRFSEGQAVLGYARRTEIHEGTYAQYITLPECYLTARPGHMTHEQAAALPLAGLTAWQSLFDAGALEREQNLLVLGATGGVGTYAVQLGRIAGAEVTAVAGRAHETYARGLGAVHYIDYQSGPLTEQIARRFPAGFDLVFDLQGGPLAEQAQDWVRPGGRMVSLLVKAEQIPNLRSDITFRYVFVEPDSSQLAELCRLYSAGELVVELQKAYPWKEFREAQTAVQSGHTRGKVVLLTPFA